MLKTRVDDHVWLIQQPDHASISGYLAAHWGGKNGFGRRKGVRPLKLASLRKLFPSRHLSASIGVHRRLRVLNEAYFGHATPGAPGVPDPSTLLPIYSATDAPRPGFLLDGLRPYGMISIQQH
jgi:hypothetical protein